MNVGGNSPVLIVCPSCARETQAGLPLCAYCSKPLALPSKCPECGHEAPAGQRKCQYCGARIPAPMIVAGSPGTNAVPPVPVATPALPPAAPSTLPERPRSWPVAPGGPPAPAPAPVASNPPPPAPPLPTPTIAAPSFAPAPPGRRSILVPGWMCLALGLLLLAWRWQDTSLPTRPENVAPDALNPKLGGHLLRVSDAEVDWAKMLYRADSSAGPVLFRKDPRTPVEVGSPAEMVSRRDELIGCLVRLRGASAAGGMKFSKKHVDGVKIIASLDGREGQIWVFSPMIEAEASAEGQAFLTGTERLGYVYGGAGQWADTKDEFKRATGSELPKEAVTIEAIPGLRTDAMEVWAPTSRDTLWAAKMGSVPPPAGTPVTGFYSRIWGSVDDPWRAPPGWNNPQGVIFLGGPTEYLQHRAISRFSTFGAIYVAAGLLLALLSLAGQGSRRPSGILDLHLLLVVTILGMSWDAYQHAAGLWLLAYALGIIACCTADAVYFLRTLKEIATACGQHPLLRLPVGLATMGVGGVTLAVAVVPLFAVLRRGVFQPHVLLFSVLLVCFGGLFLWYGLQLAVCPRRLSGED